MLSAGFGTAATALSRDGHWDARLGYRETDRDVRGALTYLTGRAYDESATSAAQLMPGKLRSLVMTETYTF